MADKNDIVILELDRPRVVWFGHKALKTLCAMTGATMDKIGEVLKFEDLEFVEKIMYCGLLTDAKNNGEVLKLEDMEDLLDKAPYEKVAEALTEAFISSIGGGEDEKNQKGTGKNPKK